MFAVAQMPMARGRSSGVNSTVSTLMLSGISSAAPRPSTARQAISSPASEANAQKPEATPKAVSAMTSMRLRPNRSPSSPPGSSAMAIARL